MLEIAGFMELSDIIPFLVVLTVLVYVHEWGHYWVAVKCGVRVEVFSIGFGPELFGWYNKAGTRWKVSAIPLGGYVKMFGQSDTEPDDDVGETLTDEEKAVSFAHKTLAQRVAIVAAGPFANFIFAVIVFFLLAWLVGTPIPHAGVGQVMTDSPAARAGVMSGDTIVAIDDEEITLFSDLQRIVQEHPETSIDLYIMRGDENIVVSVRPRGVTGEDGATYGQLGVSPDPEQVHYDRAGFFEAIWFGTSRTVGMVTGIMQYLGDMIAGDRGTEELGGPLRIAQISGDMAEGGVISLIVFMAALSVNLGLINLFPIPMLDGGHLVLYAAEFVRGKPLDEKAQEYGFGFGLILLTLIFVFVTWNDLEHFGVIEFLKNLIG
jgi:regulator of sigma E protease